MIPLPSERRIPNFIGSNDDKLIIERLTNQLAVAVETLKEVKRIHGAAEAFDALDKIKEMDS